MVPCIRYFPPVPEGDDEKRLTSARISPLLVCVINCGSIPSASDIEVIPTCTRIWALVVWSSSLDEVLKTPLIIPFVVRIRPLRAFNDYVGYDQLREHYKPLVEMLNIPVNRCERSN